MLVSNRQFDRFDFEIGELMFENVEEIKPVEGEQKLHFYYNREERIAKAPANVQEYYRGGMRPVKGVKVLFTKQNRWIFLSLIIFCAFVLIYNSMNKSRNYALINTLDCEIQAFSYEEEIYVNLKIKKNVKYSDTKAIPQRVEVQFFLIDPNNQVGEKKTEVMIYESGEQTIRGKFTDFDIIRVDAIVNVEGEEKEISTVVIH